MSWNEQDIWDGLPDVSEQKSGLCKDVSTQRYVFQVIMPSEADELLWMNRELIIAGGKQVYNILMNDCRQKAFPALVMSWVAFGAEAGCERKTEGIMELRVEREGDMEGCSWL